MGGKQTFRFLALAPVTGQSATGPIAATLLASRDPAEGYDQARVMSQALYRGGAGKIWKTAEIRGFIWESRET